MEKSYEPQTFETRWYAQWEASGCFMPSGMGTPYTILLPPPNVTGTLHMGHAFQHTLMDALIRYHRMRGYDTLWQMGTDHAGIATEMVVNRNLAVQGKGETRDSLGREQFIEKVWEWKQESGDTIARQMRRMGASGDWSREVFTMDPMPSRAVVEAFVRLYDEKLIYRGQRLVNWDPVLKTAISDLEVVSEEEDGFLWSISYPLSDGSGSLVVATTRPETMLGDTAVMVHPEDERYAHLIGRTVTLPLTGRVIPIVADDYVDREFGTGVVKVTPAHDFNDYAVGLRHKLPMINIFTREAKVNDNAPDKYRGIDRYDARKIVLADLEEAGLLIETKKHKLQVPRGDRTGQVIEPYLTDQWFVKMDTLGARGLELAESGAVKFVPPNWINTYRHWMGNIQDWCISRQLWWGHRIPAWYDDAGRIYVGHDEAGVRARHGLASDVSLRQDNDVLETWFSSALWPFSTMGWPDKGLMDVRGFDKFVPSDVLVTGFDIIFFWVARMIFMTDHFTGKVPFREVYITGLVRDAHGQKMSKSKGNVLDPIDLIDGIALNDLVARRTSGLMQPQMAAKIEKATRKEFPDGIPAFGADALRFTFASLASHGRDIKFDLNRCEGYKNFCNKLWNAARFALMNCEGFSASGAPQPATDAERWILAKLANVITDVEAQFAAYRFDLVSQALYEFTWNTLCDWFLELAKPALQGDDRAAADSTRHTLLYVLEATLRLLHPLIPFVTEEVWQHVAPKLGISGNGISVQTYPQARDIAGDHANAEADIEWLKSAVSSLRRIRSELNVAPSKHVALLLQGRDAIDHARMERFDAQLRFLARIESVAWLDSTAHAPPASAALIGELKLLVPLAGLIDLDAERTRLAKEIARAEAEIRKCEGKLSETFVSNAPAAVVAQERTRLVDWSAKREGLSQQLDQLGGQG
ncbi:MAG TPA: valine--tRNA ligase [Xanthomonadaceae bacterium]|jgi:valyl-tRNA synthetase|nr:valine--tRNA ligase [Xanthomonadaceae bacterium]